MNISARLAFWSIIENARAPIARNTVDVRENYFKVEGNWGGVLLGRTLAMFSRGAIQTNFDYGQGNGLGSTCNPRGQGPTCGHVGFGVFFPGFISGIVYNTPDLGGFQWTGGVYDPSVYKPAGLIRTPLPRFETEATYKAGGDVSYVKLFGNGLWQRLVQPGTPTLPEAEQAPEAHADAWGLGGGIRGQVDTGGGVIKLGLGGHTGQGLGLTLPLEDTPNGARTFEKGALLADPNNPGQVMFVTDPRGTIRPELRKMNGMFAIGMFSVDPIDFSVGWGISRMVEIEEPEALTQARAQNEAAAAANGTDPVALPALGDEDLNLIDSQMGISAGMYWHIDPIVLGLDYFRSHFTWSNGETQTAHTVNLGGTLLW
jgi:hypothetical protein